MKVYILIRNEYIPYEKNRDYIEGIYSSMETAKANKPEDVYECEDCTYRIEEHEVKQ